MTAGIQYWFYFVVRELFLHCLCAEAFSVKLRCYRMLRKAQWFLLIYQFLLLSFLFYHFDICLFISLLIQGQLCDKFTYFFHSLLCSTWLLSIFHL